MSLVDEVPPQNMEILAKLRNMWEFASFMQYIFLFGHVVKIDDDFDIEVWMCPGCDFEPPMTRELLVL